MTAATIPFNVREKALRTLSTLPPFSPVLNRLLSTLANDDVPFNRLAALIEKDTVLAGNVLRVVNSALYGRQGTINSVTHAIAIMGLDKLRNVALGFSVHRVWKSIHAPKGFSISGFNLHSVATGVLADRLAQCVSTGYPEGAFVAGLFHDLGKLLIALTCQAEYESFLQQLQSSGESACAFERKTFGCDHAELSALALETWNLPKPIQVAVAHHHDPEESRSHADEGHAWTLAHLVKAASDTTNQLGISADVARSNTPFPTSFPALEMLGLGDRVPELLRDFHAEFALLRAVA